MDSLKVYTIEKFIPDSVVEDVTNKFRGTDWKSRYAEENYDDVLDITRQQIGCIFESFYYYLVKVAFEKLQEAHHVSDTATSIATPTSNPIPLPSRRLPDTF